MQYIDQRKTEKRIAIINAVLETSLSLAQVIKNSGGVLRKTPRFINKRLYAYKSRADRRRRIACTMAQLAINAAIGAAQVHVIASQPIPKFPPGSNIPGGSPAIVAQNAKEEIIYPNNKTSQ